MCRSCHNGRVGGHSSSKSASNESRVLDLAGVISLTERIPSSPARARTVLNPSQLQTNASRILTHDSRKREKKDKWNQSRKESKPHARWELGISHVYRKMQLRNADVLRPGRKLLTRLS